VGPGIDFLLPHYLVVHHLNLNKPHHSFVITEITPWRLCSRHHGGPNISRTPSTF
jgi:hypothetical protein